MTGFISGRMAGLGVFASRIKATTQPSS
jgi:hypothetical protein